MEFTICYFTTLTLFKSTRDNKPSISDSCFDFCQVYTLSTLHFWWYFVHAIPWCRQIVLCYFTYGAPAWVLNHVQPFVTPWPIACQAPLFMGFPRQEYWSGLPFPSPGDLPARDWSHISGVSYIGRWVLYCWATLYMVTEVKNVKLLDHSHTGSEWQRQVIHTRLMILKFTYFFFFRFFFLMWATFSLYWNLLQYCFCFIFWFFALRHVDS